jgi:hypothetical protein
MSITNNGRAIGGRGPVHRRKVRRGIVVGVGAAVVCGVVLGGLISTPTPLATPSSTLPRSVTPQPANFAASSISTTYSVSGYTSIEAATAVSGCLSASDSTSELAGAALRDSAADSSGSTLVVTTPSGWTTCSKLANGTLVPGVPFGTYAQADGWGKAAPPTGNPPANWLTWPVEVDSSVGGFPSRASMSGWLEQSIGRAAPNITEVVVQMPGGSMVTAAVQNGFFVARQMLSSEPSQRPLGVIPVIGYDSSGKVVYDSVSASASAPAPQCFVTSNGVAVTPSSTGDICQAAVPW